MKKLLIILMLLVFGSSAFAQLEDSYNDTLVYRIAKYDGTEYVGRIVSKDAREVLISTIDRGEIYIPTHTIAEITAVPPGAYDAQGNYVGEDIFSTRYFITTNGLPIRKGEHYVQWNLFGPDFQFAVSDNVGVGVMTSWVGVPIIGTFKYSMQLNERIHAAVGVLAGTGSWAALEVGGFLPFASISGGNRRANIALTGGYGILADGNGFMDEGVPLMSVAGMFKAGKKISFVFDSFIVLRTQNVDGGALIIPGIRWHRSHNAAFQFGFGGLNNGGEMVPVPIPMVQWYRKL